MLDTQMECQAEKLSEMSLAQLYDALGTSAAGLAQPEAERRLALYGSNTIQRKPRESLVKTFCANFTHLMAILLWAAGAVAFCAGMPQVGTAIWLVNIVNGAFSFWQEYKAERATEILTNMLPQTAHVIREGEEIRIPRDEVVPGDLLVLTEGDGVPADARLLSAFSLSVQESALTGESRPVHKSHEHGSGAGDGHRELTMVFAGTDVVSGHARAVVFATGMKTRFGKIAQLTQSIRDEPSPLQKEMTRVTRTVTLLAVSIGLSFFLISLLSGRASTAESFMFAMAMIVAFVPEGMLPTVSLALAIGVQRMAERRALVKKLSAVETLGCATVICTDKTGTLTQNKMTVSRIWSADAEYAVSGSGYEPCGTITAISEESAESRQALERLLVAISRCNNARLQPPHRDAPQWSVIGDPTEGALLVAARKGGVPSDHESRAHRICELPFDSHRQRMSTVYHVRGSRALYVKGAAHRLLLRCEKLVTAGGEADMDERQKQRIKEAHDRLAGEGLRVLAVADGAVPPGTGRLTPATLERGLTFLGLVAMVDPPHEGVPEAVQKCHEAGVKIVMITGDYGLTAESLARKVGIVKDGARVVSGAELDTLSDGALRESLSGSVIFARAMPEHKLRIVTALQQAGHIVGVTGDGVNDAPALRKADIGIAMGIAGTDVAKEAADVILLDDNFASIVNAIELGRAVYANTRKFATYVFNSNMAEAVPFIASVASGGMLPLPLTLMQVLAVDLGTDVLPAIALGAEPAEPGVMARPPRDRRKALLSRDLLCRALLWYGLIEGLACISCYLFVNWLNGWPVSPLAEPNTHVYRTATTMAFAGIVMAQAGAVLCCRSENASVFSEGILKNRLLVFALAFELALFAALIYLPPLQAVFHTAPLGLCEWCFAAIWAPIIILLDECRKLLLRKRKPAIKAVA